MVSYACFFKEKYIIDQYCYVSFYALLIFPDFSVNKSLCLIYVMKYIESFHSICNNVVFHGAACIGLMLTEILLRDKFIFS